MKPHSPRHSFRRSPAWTQVLAYALLLTEAFIFSFVLQPHLVDLASRITLSMFFYITMLIVVIAGVRASVIDVSDHLLAMRGE